jgi:phosphoribosylaminoimidazolecarboxamide formyltransferase/IMP cyclohydrolase
LEDPDQVVELVDHEIGPIDLVCVNLTRSRRRWRARHSEKGGRGADRHRAGPAMLRARRDLQERRGSFLPPKFYKEVAAEFELGEVALETRTGKALEAFRERREYDGAIAAWLEERVEKDAQIPGVAPRITATCPEFRRVSKDVEEELRARDGVALRGEPAPECGLLRRGGGAAPTLWVERLQGRQLSFNNLYDVDAARSLLVDLASDGEPAAAIVKHANPCGAAVGETLTEAYRKAFASDPTSAFGGIVALSGPVDAELAKEISKVFTEVLIAPGFDEEAREIFSAKPNMTVLEAGRLERPGLSAKPVTGGLLLQHTDRVEEDSEYEIATKTRPSPNLLNDLRFAWKVAKSVKKQRHRSRQRWCYGRDRGGSDEPGRRGADRGRKGWGEGGGSRSSERRVFPFRRWCGGPGRGRHKSCHTTRRL